MATPWICRACRPLAVAKKHNFATTTRRPISTNSSFFHVSDEVHHAVSMNRPVVALETTIYTHGFPYPANLSLAARLEHLVRLHGGIPATIGILDGVARVGLNSDELARLVSCAGSPHLLKISRRDLGFALGLKDADGNRLNGGTTIAGTMVLAHMAGIRIFGTGGLGGVHRGAEDTMDISADLTELGRTPVTVISSGCKSFLDLPRTLEYLETQGVAVATFADGRSGSVDFPAFYSRDSGVRSPVVLQDEFDAAKVIQAQSMLGLQSGMHFANPIPEEHSIPHQQMETAIAQALKEAAAAGSSGAAITPYILSKIKEITGDKSVEANKALVEGNVIRATKVAVALRQLETDVSRLAIESSPRLAARRTGSPSSGQEAILPKHHDGHEDVNKEAVELNTDDTGPSTPSTAPPVDVFVAGSLAVDLACDFNPRSESTLRSPEMQTSNPAKIKQSLGGVGHNVARAAHLMGVNVRLCSAVGEDLAGTTAIKALSTAQMSSAGIKTFSPSSGSRTAQYIAINNKTKDLVIAMADMSILETPSNLNPTILQTIENFWLPQLRAHKPSYLAIDANWPPEYLAQWLSAGKELNSHITFEPVSNPKSTRLFQIPSLSVFPHPSINLSTPNASELTAMYTSARENNFFDRQDWWGIIDALGIPSTGARTQMSLATSSELVDQGIPQQSIQLLPFIPTICTKLGSQGVLLTQLLKSGDPRLSCGEDAPYILSHCNNGTEETLGVGGVYMRLFPPAEVVREEEIVSVNGVGDTFAGTLIAGLAIRGKEAKVEGLIDLAQRAAILTLKSWEAVSPGLGTLRVLL